MVIRSNGINCAFTLSTPVLPDVSGIENFGQVYFFLNVLAKLPITKLMMKGFWLADTSVG